METAKEEHNSTEQKQSLTAEEVNGELGRGSLRCQQVGERDDGRDESAEALLGEEVSNGEGVGYESAQSRADGGDDEPSAHTTTGGHDTADKRDQQAHNLQLKELMMHASMAIGKEYVETKGYHDAEMHSYAERILELRLEQAKMAEVQQEMEEASNSSSKTVRKDAQKMKNSLARKHGFD
jgi:hypothetical protein